MLSLQRIRSEPLMHLKGKPDDDILAKAQSLMGALSNLLSSPVLRNKFIQSLDGDDETVEKQQLTFSALMNSSIRLTQQSQMKVNPLKNASKAVLFSIFTLLPMQNLVDSATSLMGHDDIEVSTGASLSFQSNIRNRFKKL